MTYNKAAAAEAAKDLRRQIVQVMLDLGLRGKTELTAGDIAQRVNARPGQINRAMGVLHKMGLVQILDRRSRMAIYGLAAPSVEAAE